LGELPVSGDKQWHLSKSVPITFILAIAAQTIALIWFVATLRNDVDNNQTEIVRHEARIETLEGLVQNQAISLARIDENIKAIRDAVEDRINSNK
jgi:type VI protein secretion system component VasK